MLRVRAFASVEADAVRDLVAVVPGLNVIDTLLTAEEVVAGIAVGVKLMDGVVSALPREVDEPVEAVLSEISMEHHHKPREC